MSAQVLALAGVVLGAILAGAGSLLLTWRDETIQARTGVYLIRRIFEDAQREIRRLRREEQPRFTPEQLPDGKLWAEYRAPVSARLPLAKLQKIDEAMRGLDKLNESAARARKLGDEREAQIFAAAQSENDTALEELQAGHDPAYLTQPVIEALPEIERAIEIALDGLLSAAPSGLPGRTRNRKAFGPWYRFHWRSLTAILVVACLIGSFFLFSASGPSPATSVQDAFATHFEDPDFAACEAVTDHEDDFSCLVVEKTQPISCGRLADRAPAQRLLVSEDSAGTPAEDGSCGRIAQALAYSARRQHGDDCTAFLETGISNVPTGVSPSSPGFLRRMKALLSREGGNEGAGELPPVIVPESAFTADC